MTHLPCGCGPSGTQEVVRNKDRETFLTDQEFRDFHKTLLASTNNKVDADVNILTLMSNFTRYPMQG